MVTRKQRDRTQRNRELAEMSMTSSIIMSGPSNGADPTIHIKEEPIIKHDTPATNTDTVKKRERKVEETIIDGFAISAFESWEDLQDEINEVIASNLIKKRAAEQEAASNRRVGELVKKKKSKSSSSSKKSQPYSGDNSTSSLLQPKPKADKAKQPNKNDSSQSSNEGSTAQSSKTNLISNKSSNKRPNPENPTRENLNEGTSHDHSEPRENLDRSPSNAQQKRFKDEPHRASNDTIKHDIPTRPVDNQSHSPHLNQLYNITSNIQHIHSMQTSPMKQQPSHHHPTHHHPPTPPHPSRINPQPPPVSQSAPNHHYAQAPPPAPPPPQPQTHFNPSPQTAHNSPYAHPPSAPSNHHQYPNYMAPPMTPSPYGFYPHHRPQFSSTMSTSSMTHPADLYGGGIITEQTISRQISMIPPPNPHPFGPPPSFGQYRMSYPPLSESYNHSNPAIQSHGHPSHPFPTYPETSPQATQRLLDLGAAYSAFMTSGRGPPGSFSGYPSSQLSLMAPPQASTANIYPPEMSPSKAFEYQRAISRYSGFNPHAAGYTPPRPQAFPSAWWPPSY